MKKQVYKTARQNPSANKQRENRSANQQ